MADEGSNAPRRALDPSGDSATTPRLGGRFARAISPDEPAPESRGGRFALSPAEPPKPAAPPINLDSLSRYSRPTPPEPSSQAGRMVPPPIPVLPEPEAALPPARGRRFSASTEPNEFAPAAPRRSAASPMSPLTASEPPADLSTGPLSFSAAGQSSTDFGTSSSPAPDQTSPYGTWTRFSASPASPAPVTAAPAAEQAAESIDAAGETEVDASAEGAPTRSLPAVTKSRRRGKAKERRDRSKQVAEAPVEDNPSPEESPAAGRKRSARPALLIISGVLVVALIVAGAVAFFTLRANGNSGGGGITNSEALDPMVTAADLGQLGGLTWEANTSTADETRPLCAATDEGNLPEPQRHLGRVTRATGSEDRLVQRFDTYADDATATTAYAARAAQLSNCTADVAWVIGGNSVSGLADEATALRVRVQAEAGDVNHVLLLSRTGRSVSQIDLGTADAVKPLDLALATGASLSRQCGPDQGTCPTSIEVSATLPPPGDPVGWLLESDLPRINRGVGRWGAQPVAPVTTLGSQCEAVDLGTASGAESANMRTLLYADDPAQPNAFGVDMVTYTYKDAKAAKKFADDLDKNISKCRDRAPTATVKAGPAVKGSGADGVAIAGTSYAVTQELTNSSVSYRVTVVTLDNKVVYLMANPSKTFDFTDAQWKAIGLRAGQRASQG